jgi:peptidoglycan/LPS O-acetylase OafA/YrhL
MMTHFYGFVFGVYGRESNAVDEFVEEVARAGWIGVDLFFVLSGFLITGILLDSKGRDGYLTRFYARRVLRIVPLFYGFLLIVLLVAPHVAIINRTAAPDSIRDHAFWYFAYLQNIAWSVEAFSIDVPVALGHFWSLAVEEQFYLVWPFVVLLLSRKALGIVCLTLLPACLALRVFLASDAASGLMNLNASHVFTPARVDTLALGALLAVMVRTPGGFDSLARYAPVLAGLAGAVVVALFVIKGELSPIDDVTQTIGFTALGLTFVGLVAMTIAAAPGAIHRRLFETSILQFFGRYAYGLYVVHVLVLLVITDQIGQHAWMRDIYLRTAFGSQIPASMLLVLTAGAVSVGVAWLSWHLFEKQILKLKAFFPYAWEPAAETPARPLAPAAQTAVDATAVPTRSP